jgi:hypothetical protein
MPDNDHVPKTVSGAWRRPARAAIGGYSPESVGLGARTALARSVREASPAPLRPLAESLQWTAATGDLTGWEQAKRDYCHACGNAALAAAVVAQAEVLLETDGASLAGRTSSDVAREFGEAGLRRYADGRLWPTGMAPMLLERTDMSAADVRRYQGECLDHAGIDHVVEHLTENPGADVRAEPRPRRSRTTAEMLEEELP